MFRTVKYGLHAAVLAGLVSGTVAWAHVDKTVTLVVDGHSASRHTTAATVAGVLADAGFTAGTHDILAPAASASVDDGERIVFSRGRLLHLSVDGVMRDVWTTAPTVAAALAQLGYSTADFTSVSRAKRLPLSPTDIAVRTPKAVTLIADGKPTAVTTTEATVGDLLADLGITVGADDRVTPAAQTAISDDLKVTVQRVASKTVVEAAPIPFSTSTRADGGRAAGQTQVVQAGREGLAQVTWALVYIDGKLAGRTQVKSVVVREPVTKIVAVGTKQAPAAPPAAAAGAAASAPAAAAPAAPAGPATPAQAQAIAREMLTARGWGADQFNCLAQLWGHESGWRVNAANPSGAYGIPQALPGSKMATAGPYWHDDARTQITWGLGYISGRYGSPCGAWGFWQSNGWY